VSIMSAVEKKTKASEQGSDAGALFVERLTDFLRRSRVALLVVAAIFVVALVSAGVVSAVRQDRLAKSSAAMDSLDAAYDDWLALAEDARPSASASLLADAAAVAEGYDGMYAELRAHLVQARVHYILKDYASAEKAFLAVTDADPDSHLALVSLANASAMAEERGDKEAALAHLSRAEKDYPAAAGLARIRFNIGRIYEETKQYDKAMSAYGALAALPEESDWTKLARDRIIYLRSLGLAQ